MTTLAYLILAHAHPEQIANLVRRLHAPHVRFYLHIDANTPDTIYQAIHDTLPDEAEATFIARRPCRWGGFSLVAASLDLLRVAQNDGFGWAILLSGQDYPLQSNDAIVHTLANTRAQGFIEIKTDFDVRYRYQAWHWEAINGTRVGKLVQKLQRGLNRIGLNRSLPSPLTQIAAGSQWWILSADAVGAVLDFIAKNPQLIHFFEHTLVPDEMFFQTVLLHTPIAQNIEPRSLRFLQWPEQAWSPRTFSLDDLPLLGTRDELFARKFAADGQLTAQMDNLLLQQRLSDPTLSTQATDS
jgi:hypothetical protein